MLYIVDDEIEIQNALKWIAKSRKIDCRAFYSGEALLEALNIPLKHCNDEELADNSKINFDPNGDCIILDIRMPGINGIGAFDYIGRRKLTKRLPVIFITGHGELYTAVEAMKRGAFDFFEKPFNDNELFGNVSEAFELSRLEKENSEIKNRFKRLTAREREILDLILIGKMNKVIADDLGISMRTVEVHRANILDKMEVKTAIELASVIKH
ncbi:two-component system response regulator DctR [Oxalobacteraceae bacterium GrIS 2.11]